MIASLILLFKIIFISYNHCQYIFILRNQFTKLFTDMMETKLNLKPCLTGSMLSRSLHLFTKGKYSFMQLPLSIVKPRELKSFEKWSGFED